MIKHFLGGWRRWMAPPPAPDGSGGGAALPANSLELLAKLFHKLMKTLRGEGSKGPAAGGPSPAGLSKEFPP